MFEFEKMGWVDKLGISILFLYMPLMILMMVGYMIFTTLDMVMPNGWHIIAVIFISCWIGLLCYGIFFIKEMWKTPRKQTEIKHE